MNTVKSNKYIKIIKPLTIKFKVRSFSNNKWRKLKINKTEVYFINTDFPKNLREVEAFVKPVLQLMIFQAGFLFVP